MLGDGGMLGESARGSEQRATAHGWHSVAQRGTAWHSVAQRSSQYVARLLIRLKKLTWN